MKAASSPYASIKGVHERLKPRFAIMPSRMEPDRTKYNRKEKHKAQGRGYDH